MDIFFGFMSPKHWHFIADTELFSIIRDMDVLDDIKRRAMNCIEKDREVYRTVAGVAVGGLLTILTLRVMQSRN